MSDALRLCLGTLTALLVPPPETVDRRTAGRAMLLAPVAGAVLAVPTALLLAFDATPLLLAALTIGALALLTRGLHLDGLADTADGLGSGRRGDEAVAVMRRSDLGAFGAATLVLVVLIQVAALGVVTGGGAGPAVLVAALLVSRGVIPVLCTPDFPAARRDGLGQPFAGSVSRVAAAGAVVAAAVVAVVAALVLDGLTPAALPAYVLSQTGTTALLLALVPAVLLGPAVAVLLARHCARRFGGVTGDVYGFCVEAAFTTTLVVPALLLP